MTAAQAAAPAVPDSHSVVAGSLATAAKKTPTVKVGLARTWQYRGSSLATKTTVTDGATKLGGKVVIYAGKKKVKTLTLKNGVARYTLPKTWTKKQKAGRHTLTFKYQPTGSARYKYQAIAKKRVLTLKTPKKSPTVKTAMSHSWTYRGYAVDTKTTVTYGKTKLGGKVVLYAGKKKVKILTLKNGVARYTLSEKWTKKQKAGKHTLTFKYLPTGSYAKKYKSVSTKRILTLKTRGAPEPRITVAQVRKWIAPYSTGTENCSPFTGMWASDTGKEGWIGTAKNWAKQTAPIKLRFKVWRYSHDMIAIQPDSCPTDEQIREAAEARAAELGIPPESIIGYEAF